MRTPEFIFDILSARVGHAISSKIAVEDWREKVISEFGGITVKTVIDQISKKIYSEKKAEEHLESILKKSFSEINNKYDDKFAGVYELLESTSTANESAEDLRNLLKKWNNNRESTQRLDYLELESFVGEIYMDISGKIMNDNVLHELISIDKIVLYLKELKDDIKNTFKSESDIAQEKLYKIIALLIMISVGYYKPHKIITNTYPTKTSTAFIGRENDIEDIKEIAQTKKVILTNGIDGIGKTEICRHLFWDYHDKSADGVKHIGWINYHDNLESSLLGIFKGIEEQDSTKYKQAVKKRIDNLGNKLLLFIDNANDISDSEADELSKFACRIIMTSRKNEITSFHPFEIKNLSPEKCLEIYQDYSNDHSAESIEYIEKILLLADYHTQTVELLAKTQDNSDLSAKELLEQLTSKGFSLTGICETVDGRHDDNVIKKIFIEHLAIIFDISKIAPIEEQINVLRLFSLIAPNEPLDKKTIKIWFSLENLNPVNELIKSGWLKADENNKISIHPVISEVVRYKYPAKFEFAQGLVDKLIKELYDSDTKGLGMSVSSKLIIHSIAVAKCLEKTENEEYATLINNIGIVYDDMGDYNKALEFYEKDLKICKKILGTETRETAASYNNIGFVYIATNDYDRALKFFKKALNICKNILGIDHNDTAAAYNNIGLVYSYMGRHNNALEFYEKALNIKIKLFGTEHADIATACNNIGLLYKKMNDYNKALEFYEKALNVQIKLLGTEHPDTVSAYNNIGDVYYRMNDYNKALEFCEKALNVHIKLLGTEHPLTAAAYNNIGDVYYRMNDYNNALEFYEKDLNIREKVLGTEHLDTATAYNNIGLIYSYMGRHNNALEFYEKALNIREKVLGTEHLDTADSYNNISLAYRALHKYDKTLEYIFKKMNIYEKKFGETNPFTQLVYLKIADIYQEIGDEENADEYYWKSL